MEVQELSDVHNISIKGQKILAERKQKVSPLMGFLNETSGPRVGLEEVRKRLAKISGKKSDNGPRTT